MSISVSSVGFAVEFAWAAGESSLVPYLVDDLKVAMSLAVLVFAVNPCVAIVLQPLLGKLSDTMQEKYWLGGRLPLITALSVTSVAGILVMLFAEKISPTHAAVVCFIAFGFLDISHDALLTPSRSFINDTAPPAQQDRYHSYFSSAQSAGRLCSLVLGALPLTSIGLFTGSDEAIVFRSLMSASACVVALSCFISVWFGLRVLVKESSLQINVENEDGDMELADVEADPDVGSETQPESEPEPFNWKPLAPAVALQTSGWMGFMVVCFYWTEWLGINKELPGTGGVLKVAMTGLAVQALTGCIAGGLTPYLNARFGCRQVYVAAFACNAFSLLTAPWVDGWFTILCLLPQGFAYPVHQTNGQLLITSSAPPAYCGFVTSLCTSAIPLSQVLISLLASFFGGVPHVHGLKGLFLFTGLLTLLSGCAAHALNRRQLSEYSLVEAPDVIDDE
eukprot:TRINITY_DN34523_c0_g1_i1.p1 TRINITY_DN34523_c0_g1~~TRINITY_DN34523_c0_g1_i1.p1  ORF type:complete len:450 (+),score=47.27 TRINITY_DN34523_c0_g1_i1:63-1412(+)